MQTWKPRNACMLYAWPGFVWACFMLNSSQWIDPVPWVQGYKVISLLIYHPLLQLNTVWGSDRGSALKSAKTFYHLLHLKPIGHLYFRRGPCLITYVLSVTRNPGDSRFAVLVLNAGHRCPYPWGSLSVWSYVQLVLYQNRTRSWR